MSLTIKEKPETERPYEKLELYGEKMLSDAELLAIIIKTGTKEETSIEIAEKVLKMNKDPQMGKINFLRDVSLEELKQIKGIGRVKAIQIKAVCELAIRMNAPSNYRKIKINNSTQIANLLNEEMKYKKREIVKLILLNIKNEILKIEDIAFGGTNFANVSIKDIVGEAIKIKAPKIILAHNHPTGDSTPSQADFDFTEKVYKAAKIFDIELLDHLVFGNYEYKSIFLELKNQYNKTEGN